MITKNDKSEMTEALADNMPSLVRLLHENKDRLFQARTPEELMKEMFALMSQSFTFGWRLGRERGKH